MSKYTFTFKKGDIYVEFTTEDKDVVERQFQIWVAAADSYARSHKSQTITERAINKLSQDGTAATTASKQPMATAVPHEQTAQRPQAIKAYNQQQHSVDAEPSTTSSKVNVEYDIPPKTINTMTQEESPITQKPSINNDFESVLEKKIDNPAFEPERSKDKVFLNLLHSKNTTDKFHYLMIAAYYISEFEKKERFSLKQINTKLMQNVSELIDHSMLQEAIDQNFLELVPDLTGMADVAEYKLTRAGEEFFANRI